MSFHFKRAAIALPVAWTGVWLTYYGKLSRFIGSFFFPFECVNHCVETLDDSCLAYTDTIRRSHIRERNKVLKSTLASLPGGTPDGSQMASEAEKAAIKQRWVEHRHRLRVLSTD